MSTATYAIGEVAARFGIAVSTLRWWEKCGLLTPARQGGRRRYDEDGVRRVAMIQLWQSSAMMSLEEIAALLEGGNHDLGWRQAVRHRIAVCDEQARRIETARAHLAHMLQCPSDHPVATCPHFAEEIDGYLRRLDQETPGGDVDTVGHGIMPVSDAERPGGLEDEDRGPVPR